jgi:hypothetical protein
MNKENEFTLLLVEGKDDKTFKPFLTYIVQKLTKT